MTNSFPGSSFVGKKKNKLLYFFRFYVMKNLKRVVKLHVMGTVCPSLL